MASPASETPSTTAGMPIERQKALCNLIRHWVLRATTHAHSGHATSALSAVELMTSLYFGGTLRYNAPDPEDPYNDRVIFSKGHASPLLYSLWAAAGQVSEEDLHHYREFRSELEGHPTDRFRFAEAATGSLGQGLSIGLGMALQAKSHGGASSGSPSNRVYVLLGDSEMAEGSQWEAAQLAAYYKLDNLIGILDVNRLGQRGPTMYEHHLEAYRCRIEAFGWKAVVVDDGHDLEELAEAYRVATTVEGQPSMLIARTIKGKGISFLADKSGWHGKALDEERLEDALQELGDVDHAIRGEIRPPEYPAETKPAKPAPSSQRAEPPEMERYEIGDQHATREAYGTALCRLGESVPELIALDGEVSNSTMSETFRDKFPDRFYEMYIAEQNMVGAATGLALRGKLPFVSTFAAFFSRAFDQIRMAPHSGANIKFVGSHAGVSIGQDGPSQMGLEDIACFRTLPGSVVLYPCDAVSTERLMEQLVRHEGIAYLRTTRGKTPVIYDCEKAFPIGQSNVLRESENDQLTIIGAGATVHEALKAYDMLQEAGVDARVIDLYSVKPIDRQTLRAAAMETQLLLTVEDHYAAGGIGEAVMHALADDPVPVFALSVEKRPRSGTPEELLEDHGISAAAIVAKAKEIIGLR